jgi:hypothetical protein
VPPAAGRFRTSIRFRRADFKDGMQGRGSGRVANIRSNLRHRGPPARLSFDCPAISHELRLAWSPSPIAPLPSEAAANLSRRGVALRIGMRPMVVGCYSSTSRPPSDPGGGGGRKPPLA